MNTRRSLLTWGIILAILIGSGILTIAWPALFGSEGESTQIPNTAEIIVIPLPVPVAGVDAITLTSIQAMILMALVVGALVAGGAITFTLISWLVSRLVTNTQKEPEVQSDLARLEKRRQETIKEMRETRPVHRISDSVWTRWGTIATAIVILMFAAFTGLLVADALFPDRLIIRNDELVRIGLIIVGLFVAATLLVLALRLRSARLAAVNQTDYAPIPWDFIAIVMTGLLVVGLGVGVILLLNPPF